MTIIQFFDYNDKIYREIVTAETVDIYGNIIAIGSKKMSFTTYFVEKDSEHIIIKLW